MFKTNIKEIKSIIDDFGKELISQESVINSLSSVINEEQLKWFKDNLFKGTVAKISYESVRSELVHDFSTSNLTFSETRFDGKPVPDINFDLLYPALMNIFCRLKEISLKTNKMYWEQ